MALRSAATAGQGIFFGRRFGTLSGAVVFPAVIHATDAQGPVEIVDPWTSFTEIWFDFNRVDLGSSEMSKVFEIADYIDENPSLQVGIDRSTDPLGAEPRDQNLSERRVDAVRHALIEAGVPDYKIRAGALGDAGLIRDRRVEMLMSNAYFVGIIGIIVFPLWRKGGEGDFAVRGLSFAAKSGEGA